MSTGLKIKSTIDVSSLVTNKRFPEAQKKAAIQMLDWMSSGSRTCPAKPPIRTGVLASSGSAFVNGELVSVSPNVTKSGSPTPAKSHKEKGVTWGFNTNYAARVHFDKDLKPGPYSRRDPNQSSGNEWITQHLQKDKNLYTALVAKFLGI